MNNGNMSEILIVEFSESHVDKLIEFEKRVREEDLKSERHSKTAQKLLATLREELKSRNVMLLLALMANNEEAQRFYRSVGGRYLVHFDEGQRN